MLGMLGMLGMPGMPGMLGMLVLHCVVVLDGAVRCHDRAAFCSMAIPASNP